MKAKAMPKGTKTLEDERKDNLDELGELDAGLGEASPVELTVTRYFKNGSLGSDREEVEDEQIAVRTLLVDGAEVGLSRGLTINMGNFESVRLDVSIKVPCYLEEVSDAFEFAQRFTEERLEEEKQAVVNGRASRRRKKEDLF